MKTSEHRYFNGTTCTKYELEPKDFDYIANEFIATQDSLGISLQSISNPKLSILLRDFGIMYDNDISERRMMIATERVSVRIFPLLYSLGNDPNWFKKYIPTTTEQLYELISEYRYKPMDSVKEEDIVNFLSNCLVV
jgi:hypothetical protein